MLSESTSGGVPREVKTPPRLLDISSRSERRIRQVKVACNMRSSLDQIAGISVERKVNVNVVASVGGTYGFNRPPRSWMGGVA
jgi:hypothetical protein